MDFLISSIAFFWFIRTIKFVLFWIYLWQLKEYHIGRFVDHFYTDKGKKLLFNPLMLIKIVLLPLAAIDDSVVYILLIIYIAEVLVFGLQSIKRMIKKPVLTFKTALLSLCAFAGAGAYVFLAYTQVPSSEFIFTLLLFDILLPLGISALVLFFQPFFVFVRNGKLHQARQKLLQYKKLTVIGITGSYGKTSTKEFLYTILSQKFSVLATPEHKNSEIGIAKTILEDLKPSHEVFIVEMGSYKKGGIKLLCDMARPRIGIVTGVNEQHLALFGSLDNLLSAEGGREMVQALPKNGTMMVNGDNKYCVDLYKQIYSLAGGGIKKRMYTASKNKLAADIWTEEVVVGKNHISFFAKSQDKHMAHFHVNVLGRQNVQNLLAAILAARELGMSFEEISQACKKIIPAQAGMKLHAGAHGITVIDSSYSSNPDGVVADLDYLNIFRQKRVVVMPCLIELGSKSAQIHYQIGKKMAEVCDLAIITTKERFKDLQKGAKENGMPENNMVFIDNPQEIFAKITTFCTREDAVLLEGRVPGELVKLLAGK